uniref:ZM domain-containing protein n=1 Tax=Panagrellus redivivus TaxID=6233 RepID=A0A7E4URA7_PANRE
MKVKEQLNAARRNYMNRASADMHQHIIVTTGEGFGPRGQRTVVMSRPRVVKPPYYEEPPPPYPGLEPSTSSDPNYGYPGSSTPAIRSVPVPDSTNRPPAYTELEIQQLPGSIGPSMPFTQSTVTPLAMTQAHVLPQKT